MRQVVFIFIAAFILFLVEFFIFNFIGKIFRPNLLLLLVIFINLYLGVRFGIVASVLAGVLADSFSSSVFGIHIFSFLVCTYLTMYLKKYVYQIGSRFSRLLLVCALCFINFIVLFTLNSVFRPVAFFESLRFVLFPEIILTAIVATYVLNVLKSCALKFTV